MVATIFVSIPIQQNNHRIFHTSHTASQLHYQFLFQFGIEIWGLTYGPKYLKVLMTPNTIFVTWILHDVNNQVPKFLGIWAFR